MATRRAPPPGPAGTGPPAAPPRAALPRPPPAPAPPPAAAPTGCPTWGPRCWRPSSRASSRWPRPAWTAWAWPGGSRSGTGRGRDGRGGGRRRPGRGGRAVVPPAAAVAGAAGVILALAGLGHAFAAVVEGALDTPAKGEYPSHQQQRDDGDHQRVGDGGGPPLPSGSVHAQDCAPPPAGGTVPGARVRSCGRGGSAARRPWSPAVGRRRGGRGRTTPGPRRSRAGGPPAGGR